MIVGMSKVTLSNGLPIETDNVHIATFSEEGAPAQMRFRFQSLHEAHLQKTSTEPLDRVEMDELYIEWKPEPGKLTGECGTMRGVGNDPRGDAEKLQKEIPGRVFWNVKPK